MSEEKISYNIGSRKSKLAMIQTRYVMAQLEALNPSHRFQIHEQETLGDKVLDVALSKIGDKGLFTQELEDGLRSGAIDFAVHSLKDMPTRLPEGLVIGAILERANPIDVVLMRSDLAAKGIRTLKQLNETGEDSSIEVTVGTSSLRRQSQLQALYPNLKCIDIRGNLDTRIKKLENRDFSNGAPDYSAIVLASAGLERQGSDYTSRVTQQLTENEMYYAVGQGALAVECRAGDAQTLAILSKLHHEPTALACLAERSFLRTLEGGCHAPIGVVSSISSDGQTLSLKGRVLSLDGSVCIQVDISGPATSTEQLGEQLAQKALSEGADKILASLAKKK